jgi:hypothetical protein
MNRDKIRILQLEKQLREAQELAIAQARTIDTLTDRADRYLLALRRYGFDAEEISTIESSEANKHYNELLAAEPYTVGYNNRQRQYIEDMAKYGKDEAERRELFRVMKADGIKHEDLLTLWKKH